MARVLSLFYNLVMAQRVALAIFIHVTKTQGELISLMPFCHPWGKQWNW